MKIIYCDESNLDARSGDFLLYGGLTIDADLYWSLSEQIWSLRRKYNIPQDAALKYLPAPKGLDNLTYMEFKKDCIRACIDFGCYFLVYQTLHDVAKDTDEARRNGINELCLNFSYFLEKENTSGLILIDRFNDEGNKIDGHLARKFSVGLEGLPYSGTYPLKRVVGLHYSAIGQSQMSSLIDIVLGTYRTAINIYSRKQSKIELADNILDFLRPLFRMGYDDCIPRTSISFSPLSIRVYKYRLMYIELIERMESAGYRLTQNYKSSDDQVF